MQGPHWHTNKLWGKEESDNELMAAFNKAMRIVLEYLLDNLKPNQRVWVRSSPYGHAKCSQYTQPDQVPHPPTRKPGEFQWDMHEKFDQVWRVGAKQTRIAMSDRQAKERRFVLCTLGYDRKPQ